MSVGNNINNVGEVNRKSRVDGNSDATNLAIADAEPFKPSNELAIFVVEINATCILHISHNTGHIADDTFIIVNCACSASDNNTSNCLKHIVSIHFICDLECVATLDCYFLVLNQCSEV